MVRCYNVRREPRAPAAARFPRPRRRRSPAARVDGTTVARSRLTEVTFMWRTGSVSRTMMYLAAASALYPWRFFNRDRNAPAAVRRRGAGITDLPPEQERAEQESLPPRGRRRSEYHS